MPGNPVVTETLHQLLPLPSVALVGSAGTKRMALAPAISFALVMNCRSEP